MNKDKNEKVGWERSGMEGRIGNGSSCQHNRQLTHCLLFGERVKLIVSRKLKQENK